MSNTANLQMPLVQQSQAQKHITVNEALSLLDATTQLSLESISLQSPPNGAASGHAYGLPSGLNGDWQGNSGSVAIFSNGGWRFVSPQAGWRAYVKDQGKFFVYDGEGWLQEAISFSPNGAGVSMEVIEIEHSITAGTTQTVLNAIPAYTSVIGVTGRITDAVTGSLDSWHLGVADSPRRYGSKLTKSKHSWLYGLTGQPMSYYEATSLVMTARNGSFSGGSVRFAVHAMRMYLPRV